jgi:hypothetical protein
MRSRRRGQDALLKGGRDPALTQGQQSEGHAIGTGTSLDTTTYKRDLTPAPITCQHHQRLDTTSGHPYGAGRPSAPVEHDLARTVRPSKLLKSYAARR